MEAGWSPQQRPFDRLSSPPRPACRTRLDQGVRAILCSRPGPRSGRHERLLTWFPECHVVAYGHTHAPEVTKVGTVWIVNPEARPKRRRASGHTMAVLRGAEPVLVKLR